MGFCWVPFMWPLIYGLTPAPLPMPELIMRMGRTRNVCWNSTSDYELLRPYVLADSVGGDLQHEQYRFYGGYARVDGRFNYGLTASYRAQHEYRQVDPRARATSRLTFLPDLSLGYLWGHYAVGLAGGLRIYKQQQSVAFYDQNGANTSELHFTGLGTFYQRYSGTTYTSVQYRGTGWHASLTLVPRERDGWYALADYERLVVDRNLTGVNNVTPDNAECAYPDCRPGLPAHKRTYGLGREGHRDLRLAPGGRKTSWAAASNSDHLPLGSQTLYDDHCLNARSGGHRGSGSAPPACGRSVLLPVTTGTVRSMNIHTGRRKSPGWMQGRRWPSPACIKPGCGKPRPEAITPAHVDGQLTSPTTRICVIYNYLSTSYLRQSDDWAHDAGYAACAAQALPPVRLFSCRPAYVKRFYGEKLQDDNVQLSVGLCF